MTHRLLPLAALALACHGGDLVLPENVEPGEAARLVMAGGNGQSATTGALLPAALAVRLVDKFDNPVQSQAVTWLVTAGGGTIAPADTVTDAQGRSTARWTLGTAAGAHKVTAVVLGSGIVDNPITFTATATAKAPPTGSPPPEPPPSPPPPRGPDRLVFRVQPAGAEENRRIAPAVQVALVDDRGNVVTDRRGAVQLELLDAGRTKLRGRTRRDLTQGVAAFSDLRIDREGRYRLRASLQGFTPIESGTFDITDD